MTVASAYYRCTASTAKLTSSNGRSVMRLAAVEKADSEICLRIRMNVRRRSDLLRGHPLNAAVLRIRYDSLPSLKDHLVSENDIMGAITGMTEAVRFVEMIVCTYEPCFVD